jgi:hypothetical protein
MTALPIAAFLAGALLSLLLPTLLLIALVVWYWMFVRQVPEPTESPEPPAPATPAPSGEAAPPPADTR